MDMKRIMLLASGILLMLALLLGRLMQIQLIQTEKFSKHHINLLQESVQQRTQEMILEDGRGVFLDHEGIPLSYEERNVLIIFPFIKEIHWERAKLANILNISLTEFENDLRTIKEPVVYKEIDEKQMKAIDDLHVPGIYAVKKKYTPDDPLASQFIGIIGENERLFKERYPEKNGKEIVKIGLSGLQAQFDQFLLPEMPSKLVFHVDGIGQPLFGIDVKYTGQGNPYYPLKIKTTINRDLQTIMEQMIDHYEIKKGGAILLDIQTNDILAIASRPVIKVNMPYSDDGTKNMMFEAHIPGSIFKTVVAAGAIQEGLVDDEEIFDCQVNIRGEPDSRNLGNLRLKDSFSQSCNHTFAILAKRLQEKDENNLEKYAKKLGLIGTINWTGNVFQVHHFQQFFHEPSHIFMDEDRKTDDNYIAQTGIGQHEVRLSPVAVANMMATIARGGERKSVRSVSEIQYANGTVMYSFPLQSAFKDTLSSYTAMKLQSLLREVIIDEQGTGALLNVSPYTIAGKTGTAQTGVERNQEELYHKWFAGYFPFDNPKYALVVLNMEVPDKTGSVLNAYQEIVQMIYEWDQ